jgi:CDP-paratose 2-epimerase
MPLAKRVVLITGSSGLIGSEVCRHLSALGYRVHGLDDIQRAVFFGPAEDTRWKQRRLQRSIEGFVHHEMDIRSRDAIAQLIADLKPQLILHAAVQPSHDRAASILFDDFDTNATGTLNLLEAARRHCPESPFVYMSTKKVYGDAPNRIEMVELGTHFDYDDPAYADGLPETLPGRRSGCDSANVRRSETEEEFD